MTIVEAKYLPLEDGSTGKPIHIRYDNGNIAVFNFVEEHPMYEQVMALVEAGELTIQEADQQ